MHHFEPIFFNKLRLVSSHIEPQFDFNQYFITKNFFIVCRLLFLKVININLIISGKRKKTLISNTNKIQILYD